ncbi:MAG: methyltransferase [Cyanobacteriota bacterium]|nr:methyltransferase [Cyanobacteriota bacterium]
MSGTTAAYYDRVNRDLLQRIPVTARTVLEVGCGAGALGAAFKAINPNCRYVGIETVAAASAAAAGRLDQVLGGDVEDPGLALPALPPLDALIYGDVLEHLRDPWSVLARQVPLLADDGLLLACIPNVQHWSVLEQLLRGEWPLAEEGIFDRTHLRWFTRAGIEALVKGCGLHLLELQPRVFHRDQAEAFVQRLAPALPGLGLDQQALLAGVAPLQYVVSASRRPRPPLHLDALSLRPQAGMVEVRMAQPLTAVASLGGIGLRLRHGQLDLLRPNPALPRLLIWQRPALRQPDALPQLRQLLANDYVIVVEYDDDPDHWPEIAANSHLTFRGVHAVQVSTERLAGKLRPHNPEVAVFGNALASLPPPRPPRPAGAPLRLFFGALNREADWAPWIGTLNRVLQEAPELWQVEVVHDRAFFDALTLPARRFTPTCDYPTYRQRLAGCDIAFLPLADTAFNRCKSDLKAVEAAGHGLAPLASPVVYGVSLHEGQTGRFFTTAAELAGVLREWRQDPGAMAALGERARAWVASSRLQHHQTAARAAWYRDLWDRRQALTAALLERVPELAASGD